MAQPRLRLGVVGANPNVGWASRTHMPALAALPDYDLTAVCTTKQESAQASAQKYEAKRAYWDFRQMVVDPEVDVVDVCVKVPYHHEIVMAALEAGKHVYCEWPLGATLAQAREMDALATKRGLHTMVGLQARGAPSILQLRQLIAQGYVGRVLSATMSQLNPGLLQERTPDGNWRADRSNGAHTLSIAAGHALDAFCFCLGPFTEVAAIVATQAPEWPLQGGGSVAVSAPDHVSVMGKLEGGAVATVEIGSVPWHGSGFRMQVFGTEGTLVASADQQVQAVGVRLQGGRRGESGLADLEVPQELRWVPAEVPSGTPVHLAQMIRRFGEGIRAGSTPQPTFAEAVRNHHLLDAIERSSETGSTVRLDDA